MEISHVRPEEVESLLDISLRTFVEAFAHRNDPVHFESYIRQAFTKSKLEAELNHPSSAFYFVRDDNKIIGYLKLNIGDAQTEYQDQNSMEIERIYIDAPYQGGGRGGQLIQFAIEKAAEAGVDFIWLGVWEKNEEAIRFYQRHGFEIVGIHRFMVGEDEQWDRIMRRELPSL